VSQAEGVLITGVYGSGKSSVAAEIAYLLEQHGTPYALLDLDYLSWTGRTPVIAPPNSSCCART
jgi:adenylylsulfate kinase-like enzyme